MRLAGRTALVTGAARGIGRAIAQRLACDGAAVIVNDIDRDEAAATVGSIEAAEGRAVMGVADVTDRDAVAAMLEVAVSACGGLDIVVNNAIPGLEVVLAEEYRPVFDVVVAGGRNVVELALPWLRRSPAPAVVFVSSVNALVGMRGVHMYSAAKAAVLSYVRTLALEHGPAGIRVNAVSPGSIRTAVWDPILEQRPTALEEVAGYYALGRIGEPQEVAAAVAFLASDEASFITGANLMVDGGLSAGLMHWDVT